MPSVLIITNVSPGAIYTTLYNKMLTSGRSVLSLGTPVPSTKRKTDYQDITEILLKVALNTITLTPLSGNKKSQKMVTVTKKKITHKMVTVTKKKITHKMVTVTKKKIENSLIDHYC